MNAAQLKEAHLPTKQLGIHDRAEEDGASVAPILSRRKTKRQIRELEARLREQVFPAAVRREANREANKARPGFAVGVIQHAGQKGPTRLVAVKLGRGTTGRPPRGGVHIPQPARAAKGLVRVSKHAKQQHRDGKFGNKGFRTICAKQEFIVSSSEQANVQADNRRFMRYAKQRGLSLLETARTYKPFREEAR